MKKFKLVKILALIAVLVLGFGLAACDNLPVVYASEEDYNNSEYHLLQLIMNAGEKQSINTGHFKGLGIDFANAENLKLEILSESSEKVVTIKDNVITAVNNGYAEVYAVIRERVPAEASKNGRAFIRIWKPNIAQIHVINEAAMMPITTAQQLAGMKNDLDGKYILKADIDLAGWGEWAPIGKSVFYTEPSQTFTGFLVNSGGYKIKNLTITTSETTKEAGLFGYIGGKALVSGIILEDVFIDVSDYTGGVIGSPRVGGVTASMGPVNGSAGGWVINCSVSGVIFGGGYTTGGVIGISYGFNIFNCTFTGEITGPESFDDSVYTGVGGIAGRQHSIYTNKWNGYIKDCSVYADIKGYAANAGGIVGYNELQIGIENCVFTGTVAGKTAGQIIGYDFGTDGPIDYL